jgi:hypothetical protein
MHCASRSLLASLTIAACLWPHAVAAEAQHPSSTDPSLTIEQVTLAFATAGFDAEPPRHWDWTSPPVTSFQVHDRATNRVATVLVYASTSAAQASRTQAEAHEPMPNSANPGAHLLLGFGPSVWNANVAMVETTKTHLKHLSQMQADCDSGAYVEADLLHDAWFPTFDVDVDFQQALNNSAVDL